MIKGDWGTGSIFNQVLQVGPKVKLLKWWENYIPLDVGQEQSRRGHKE